MGCGSSNNRDPLTSKYNLNDIKDKHLLLEAYSSELKEVKGFVIDDKTNIINTKVLNSENPGFVEELIHFGDESDSTKPWITNIIQPDYMIEENKGLPSINLKVSHIFGYRCMDSRGNLFFLDDSNIIYHTGSFGIVQNIKTKKQKIFGGNQKKDTENSNISHTNDIVSITIFKGDVSMVATGQIDARPTILIWSPHDTSVVYAKLQQDTGSKQVGSMSFDNKGKYLISLGRDEMNSFFVFEIQSKEIIWKDITGNDILFDVKFSPNNNEFCIIGVNSVYFCNLKTKEKLNHARSIKKFKNTSFTCIEYSDNGEKVITSTSTGLLIVWTSNKENSIVKDLIEIKVSEYSILNMRICETSKKIYCTDSNRKLFIINMENNAIENNIVLSDNVKGIDINLRGKLLLGLANGNIFIKNLKSGRQRDISYSHSYGKLRGLDYTLPNFVN